MAVTVRITETYDLKTTINKIGIIGIHTPNSSQIRKLYPGLAKNFRFMRLLKCDVVGVCASALPADPLQVGVGAGQVAPEDMFNPILYKAVSNESFENIVSRIYTQSDVNAFGSLNAGELSLTETAQFNLYYAFLGSRDGWKKSMPQNGFALRGLYPICYQMVNTFGNCNPVDQPATDGTLTGLTASDDRSVKVAGDTLNTSNASDLAVTFRGKSVKMPRIPMHYGLESTGGVAEFPVPKTFVACFLTPPARMTEFYYRMRVTWTIRFEELISTSILGTATIAGQNGSASYGKNFSYASSKADMENKTDSVDTDNVIINKIMEN